MHLFENNNNNSITMYIDIRRISLWLTLNKYLPTRSNNQVHVTIGKLFIRNYVFLYWLVVLHLMLICNWVYSQELSIRLHTVLHGICLLGKFMRYIFLKLQWYCNWCETLSFELLFNSLILQKHIFLANWTEGDTYAHLTQIH